MSTPTPKNPIAGRHGIGPISAAKLSRRLAFLRRGEIFQRNREMAIAARDRGDREGARFWGAQARADWLSLAWTLASPNL